MKKIHILFGTTIVNQKKELEEMLEFIDKCNLSFEYDYSVNLVCDVLNDYSILKYSEMCIFIFFDKSSKKNIEEIDFAYNFFKQNANNKPKIYIYFKKNNDLKFSDEIVNVMSIVDQTYKHFYSLFDNIDTVKLRILLNLKFQEMDYIELKCSDDSITLNDNSLLNVANIDEYKKNIGLENLKREYELINEEYLEMKPIFSSGFFNDEFKNKYIEVTTKRIKILNLIDNLKIDIFNLSLGISNNIVHGNVTMRMNEAIRLFENGDLEGAISILNIDDIEKEFEKIEENQRRASIIFIREHLLAIDILIAMYNYPNRFKEIEERFKKVTSVALKFDVELDCLFLEAKYYYNQKEYLLSEELFEKCLKKYEEISYDNLIIQRSHRYLGNIYRNTYRYEKALEEYLYVLSLHKDIKTYDDKKDLALIYNNLALAYKKLNDLDKAKYYILKSIEIREELIKGSNPPYYDLVMGYNNLGSIYNACGEHKEALEIYQKSLILKNDKLDLTNENNIASIALNYNNIAMTYKDLKNYSECEKYYIKALEIKKELFVSNPIQTTESLIIGYKNLGILYIEMDDNYKAEANLMEAIKLVRKMLTEKKYAEKKLILLYKYLLVVYEKDNRMKEIEDIKKELIMLFEDNEDYCITKELKTKYKL